MLSGATKPLGQLPVFADLAPRRARVICQEVGRGGGGELLGAQCAEVLQAFGISLQPQRIATAVEAETKGAELELKVQLHPLFGPVVSLGLGGLYGELLGDATYRVTPMTERDAAEMVRSLRSYPLLRGYQGHPAADIPALETLLLRVSRLVEEVPELGTLQLTVRAFGPGAGATIAAARLSVLPTGENDDA